MLTPRLVWFMISFEMNYEFSSWCHCSPFCSSRSRMSWHWHFGRLPLMIFACLPAKPRSSANLSSIGNDWINYFAICFSFSSPSRRCRFDGMCQNLNEIYGACVKAIIRNIIFMLHALRPCSVLCWPINNNESEECARLKALASKLFSFNEPKPDWSYLAYGSC